MALSHFAALHFGARHFIALAGERGFVEAMQDYIVRARRLGRR
jgi:hypothetical protein